MNRLCHTAIAFAAAMLCALPADGRVLQVGPARALKQPSQAAALARDGDVVRIDPGVYADCAVWRASRLTIEAAGPPVTLAGKTCNQQGIFIVYGNGITVRGLTFAGAEVVWHNGAGIRVFGDDLTVDKSHFWHNENGILSGGSRTSTLRITDSEFIGNGACIAACAHGVYAGAGIYLLDIERCVFLDTRTAHHVKSRALNTIVRDSRIEDGATGTASYLIDTPDGGNLLVLNNRMEKGPNSGNPAVAISIGAEGVKNPTVALVVTGNWFRNDLPERTVFVRNNSTADVELYGNTIVGDVQDLAILGRP